ncbi:MAG: GGDEF domain-containing protein [Planctomycetota bacterium]|jgi:diguanylate cyclase (GGDEF)-like protein
MSKQSVVGLLLVSLLPAAALVLGGAALLSGTNSGSWLAGGMAPFFFLLCTGTGVVALALLLWGWKSRAEADLWKSEVEGIRALLQARDAEMKKIRGEVEILTAVREIGVIVNADDEFEVVLSKVLEVVGEALKAEDLVLFLADGASKSLEPVARRRQGKCVFRRGLKTPPVSRQNVNEALIHGRLLEAEEWNAYSFAVPLIVEREAVGVLKAFIPAPLPGESHRPEDARDFLHGVQRHLALAIKTPSLYSKAVLDGLTGLHTRRHMDSQIEGYFNLAVRRHSPLSVILADIDHFKRINDTHGHPSGDRILKAVSRVILREIRKYDSAYRYGGEELCILLPETEWEDAKHIAERIRQRVERQGFRGDKNQKISATLSLGVAPYREGMGAASELIAAADRALYRAKEGGRNRVECETLPPRKGGKKKRGRKARKRKSPGQRGPSGKKGTRKRRTRKAP